MLYLFYEKIKGYLKESGKDLLLGLIVFLVALASFGLGRLSAVWPKSHAITIRQSEHTANLSLGARVGGKESGLASTTRQKDLHGMYVASKNGTAYHFPWCPGAQKMKEGNKIWFQTKEEAEAKARTRNL